MHRLPEKLWYTKNKDRAVGYGDPDAWALIGAAGHLITDAEAARLGLTGDNPAVSTAPNSSDPMLVTPLPDDFPGRDKLVAFEITHVEQLTDSAVPLNAEALRRIKGIGKATAAAILAAIEDLE